MRSTYMHHSLYMIIFVIFLISPLVAGAQQCERRAVIQQESDVYQSPPHYVTGMGWQGERTDVLPNGTQVLECTERSVAFGFSSVIWSQIAYRRGSDWRYGWILQETLHFVSYKRGQPATLKRASDAFMPVALQVVANNTAGQADRWLIPDSAPAPSAPPNVAGMPQASPANQPTLGMQLILYWPLFVAMLFGMIAKAAVDLVEEWNKELVVWHLRNGLVAILVSPIVFLGFLNAGNFNLSQQTFLVLLMLAFQNGFFWQTILKKGELGNAPPPDNPQNAKEGAG
jgi:hypothetical protein